MRWGMKDRKGDLCSVCTSMQITRSCYIDCQGSFYILGFEDLRFEGGGRGAYS